jgi:hypothetical protein
MTPIFAARYSLLNGDEYELQHQMNSRLGKEAEPKHDSASVIYVPEPARRAVLQYGENVRPIGEASGEDMGKRSKKSTS